MKRAFTVRFLLALLSGGFCLDMCVPCLRAFLLLLKVNLQHAFLLLRYGFVFCFLFVVQSCFVVALLSLKIQIYFFRLFL